MLSALRSRITYTNVAVTVALLFAMTGGAYAAKKYVITSTKQISPSVLKSLKGASGVNGAPGAAGVQGAQGPAGPQGAVGAAGAKGETGPAGKEGSQGKEGKEGKEGKAGKEGSPWTASGTLPSGKTETGAWAFGNPNAGANNVTLPISFPILLPASLDENHVHYINTAGKELIFIPPETIEEKPPTACLGTAAAPTANAGNLCVYTGFLHQASLFNSSIQDPSGGGVAATGSAGTTGAYLHAFGAVSSASGAGTWAVTAP